VPLTPLREVAGNGGTDPPGVISGIALNAGVIAGMTVTGSCALAIHPVAEVGVNVYVPLCILLITAGLQVPAIPLTEEAGNVGACVPAQKGAMALNVGMVLAVTVTITSSDVAVQVVPPVVTVYVPLWVTVMLCVVAPVLQVLPLAAEEVSTTEPLSQKFSGPDAVIVGVPDEIITCNVLACPLPQLLEGVTVRVCVPGVAQFTVAELPLSVSVPPSDKDHV